MVERAQRGDVKRDFWGEASGLLPFSFWLSRARFKPLSSLGLTIFHTLAPDATEGDLEGLWRVLVFFFCLHSPAILLV